MTRATLEAHNYQVITASGEAEGAALYAQHQNRIKVVLTDQGIPALDGSGMLPAIEDLNPSVKVICASASQTNHVHARNAVDMLLLKPYTAGQLLRAVRHVLDAPPVETDRIRRETTTVSTRRRGHGELILVVDDETGVREMVRDILAANGYRVLTAENGAVGVSIFAERPQEIQAVLIDVVMPVMDGPTATLEMLKVNPLVKIIAMSGTVQADETTAPAHVFLQKPYTVDVLLQTLAGLLESHER